MVFLQALRSTESEIFFRNASGRYPNRAIPKSGEVDTEYPGLPEKSMTPIAVCGLTESSV